MEAQLHHFDLRYDTYQQAREAGTGATLVLAVLFKVRPHTHKKKTNLNKIACKLNTQILILAEAPLRFVLKVFSVLRRWRARYSVPSGCLGRTVVQNLTPDVAFLLINASLSKQKSEKKHLSSMKIKILKRR